MGEIIFEGDPPYAALAVQAASTGRHTLDPTKVLLSIQLNCYSFYPFRSPASYGTRYGRR